MGNLTVALALLAGLLDEANLVRRPVVLIADTLLDLNPVRCAHHRFNRRSVFRPNVDSLRRYMDTGRHAALLHGAERDTPRYS